MEKIDYLEVVANEEDSEHHQQAQTVLIGLVSVVGRCHPKQSPLG